MRALVYTNHSLSFEPHYPDPALGEGEALIHVLLAGICNTDLPSQPPLLLTSTSFLLCLTPLTHPFYS
jgi:hypothetical protein